MDQKQINLGDEDGYFFYAYFPIRGNETLL